MEERFGHGRKMDAHGFTYIALLIFIAILSMGFISTWEVWNTAIKRENEQELLFAGSQIRNAINMYYLQSPGAGGRLPTSLEDLLKDPRYPATKRYLRKIYLDPVTKSSNWELLKGPNGEIFGVHSASEDEPAKKTNFSLADQGFEGKMKYSDWVFMISARFAAASAPISVVDTVSVTPGTMKP
ncbi:MAG: type II secretion system protein [Burkholderiales bacterium]